MELLQKRLYALLIAIAAATFCPLVLTWASVRLQRTIYGSPPSTSIDIIDGEALVTQPGSVGRTGPVNGIINGSKAPKTLSRGRHGIAGGTMISVPIGCLATVRTSGLLVRPYQASRLYIPSGDPAVKAWAVLESGTFEITADKTGAGRVKVGTSTLLLDPYGGCRLFVQIGVTNREESSNNLAAGIFSIKCEKGTSKILHDNGVVFLHKGHRLEFVAGPTGESFRIVDTSAPGRASHGKLVVPAGKVSVIR